MPTKTKDAPTKTVFKTLIPVAVMRRRKNGLGDDGVKEERWDIVIKQIRSFDDIYKLRKALRSKRWRELGTSSLSDQLFGALAQQLGLTKTV
jgi:hypothetical protein